MRMLLAAAILFFHAGSVSAGSCPSIENAELKDMSSEKLVKTYCTYAEVELTEHKATMGVLELEKKAYRQGQALRWPGFDRHL